MSPQRIVIYLILCILIFINVVAVIILNSRVNNKPTPSQVQSIINFHNEIYPLLKLDKEKIKKFDFDISNYPNLRFKNKKYKVINIIISDTSINMTYKETVNDEVFLSYNIQEKPNELNIELFALDTEDEAKLANRFNLGLIGALVKSNVYYQDIGDTEKLKLDLYKSKKNNYIFFHND